MKKQRHVGIVPLLLVAGAVFLSFFWNLGSYGIFDLDEGLYVEAAREMNLRGDYIIPMVNGVEFFEKPPLVYWLSAASQLVLGQNEFAARLPAATASATLAILVFLIGNRFLGSKSGLLTGLAYALNPIVFGAGRQLTMDAVLALWMAAALFAFFKGYSAGEKGSAGWFYGFWACCAFGVLSKGAPGIVLPLVIVFVFLIMADGIGPGMRRFFTGTRRLFGIPLFLTIIIPWHAAAWQVGGRPFVDAYIIRQHLGRCRGGTAWLDPVFQPFKTAGEFERTGTSARRRCARVFGPKIQPHAWHRGSY